LHEDYAIQPEERSLVKQIAIPFVVLALAIPILASAVIRRGTPIAAGAKSVTVTHLLETPDAYEKNLVIVEGIISRAVSHNTPNSR
jgi:hypothetical protein